MVTNQIQELFDKHTIELTYTDNTMRVMNVDDFADALKEEKVKWYRKLICNLLAINTRNDVDEYINTIKNEIRELENGN